MSFSHGNFDNILQESKHVGRIQTNFPFHFHLIVNRNLHHYYYFMNCIFSTNLIITLHLNDSQEHQVVFVSHFCKSYWEGDNLQK
jgi:pentose-5-phosphate-3-epimerase